MAEYGADSGGRVKGLTIVKPIIYGNIARYFGKKREEDGHTHQWTVYVKPYKNEDMSAYIKKINFKLHDSYPNSNRAIEVILSKSHKLDGRILEVKRYIPPPPPKPVPKYDNKFFLTNVSPTTTKEGFENFMEAKSKVMPTEFFLDKQKGQL